MSVLVFCQWLEEKALRKGVRGSSWAVRPLASIRVVGLGLFGMAVLLDLRALNAAFKRVTVAELGQLRPWAMAGVIVMLISGGLTFLNAPVEYYNNALFRIKLVFLLLVGF